MSVPPPGSNTGGWTLLSIDRGPFHPESHCCIQLGEVLQLQRHMSGAFLGTGYKGNYKHTVHPTNNVQQATQNLTWLAFCAHLLDVTGRDETNSTGTAGDL